VTGSASVSMLSPSEPVETPPRSASSASVSPARSTGSSLNTWPVVAVAGSNSVAGWAGEQPRPAGDPGHPCAAHGEGVEGIAFWKSGVTHLEGVERSAFLKSPVAFEGQPVGVDEAKRLS
jgi:hypothetical protein